MSSLVSGFTSPRMNRITVVGSRAFVSLVIIAKNTNCNHIVACVLSQTRDTQTDTKYVIFTIDIVSILILTISNVEPETFTFTLRMAYVKFIVCISHTRARNFEQIDYLINSLVCPGIYNKLASKVLQSGFEVLLCCESTRRKMRHMTISWVKSFQFDSLQSTSSGFCFTRNSIMALEFWRGERP